MSVIQGIKDLIGKEDVNWGNATGTFTRYTHLGGTVSIHYIDDTVIPATALGGYIDDHLHRQNTDSLTTTTFGINSTGNSVVLSSTGLTAARTFTFPDTSNQALVGATDLASTAATYGASRVGVADSGTYFTGTNVETVLQEVGADITTLEASAHNRGMRRGFKLGYLNATSVSISGGMWALTDTTDRHVYTNSQITFITGAAGSNATSSALGANEIHYIYIDLSAVDSAATSLLTAAMFKNIVSTAGTGTPSYSHSKAGWYNTDGDRCIGAILTDGSNNIKDFDVFSDHYYRYNIPVNEFATAAANTSYTGGALDLSSSVPIYATRARLRFTTQGSSTTFYFDTESSAVTPEAQVIHSHATIDTPINTSQALYWYASAATTTAIDTTGYYIDEL